MRTKVRAALPEVVLTRILEAFGQELIDASEEEIMEAAKDLGMELQMKGSGAFVGLTFPTRWQLSDFFDLEAINQHIGREAAGQITKTSSTEPERETHRPRQSEISRDRKNFGEK